MSSSLSFQGTLTEVSDNPTSKTASILPEHPIGIGEKCNLEWKQENKCFVCKKKFGLGKRHHCRYCGNSVCSRHSSKVKRPESEEMLRICDICDAELIRQEIRLEIQQELDKLQENISIARESYDKVEAERIEKTEMAAKLQEELTANERLQRKLEKELMDKLNAVISRGTRASGAVDDIKKELDASHVAESEMNEKRVENEAKTDRLKEEILELKGKKIDLMAQLEHLSYKLKGSLELDQVLPLLCDKCKHRVKLDQSPAGSTALLQEGPGDSYLSNTSSLG